MTWFLSYTSVLLGKVAAEQSMLLSWDCLRGLGTGDRGGVFQLRQQEEFGVVGQMIWMLLEGGQGTPMLARGTLDGHSLSPKVRLCCPWWELCFSCKVAGLCDNY